MMARIVKVLVEGAGDLLRSKIYITWHTFIWRDLDLCIGYSFLGFGQLPFVLSATVEHKGRPLPSLLSCTTSSYNCLRFRDSITCFMSLLSALLAQISTKE